MKSSLKIAVVILLLSSSLLMAAQDPTSSSVVVDVATVEEKNIAPTISVPGNLVSRRLANISTEQTGRVIWTLDIGDTVKQGEAIAKLDNERFQLRLAEQKAQLRRIEANLTYFEKQMLRLEKLVAQQSTARTEYDRNERDFMVAKEELSALEWQIKQTELDIKKSVVVAPFDGQIADRFVQTGEFIMLGAPVAQVIDIKSKDILVNAPLSIATAIQKGELIDVEINGNQYQLPIRTWSESGRTNSRTFELRLLADNVPNISGSAAIVELPKENKFLAQLVHRDALVLRESQNYVVVVNEDLSVSQVPVKIGQGIGHWIVVEGDLVSGQKVVIKGGERLSDGDKIRLSNDEVKVSTIAAANGS